jgi:hypothetical protein
VLISKGVTAWRRLLTYLTSTTAPTNTTRTPPGAVAARTQASARLPDPVAAELVHVLAAIAVALAGT